MMAARLVLQKGVENMLFDTHAHYYDAAFDADRDAVLSALPQKGVDLVMCPGCDLESSRESLTLAERYPFVYAAVGIHPENLEPNLRLSQVISQLHVLCTMPKVQAIGEIGLDYYWVKDPKDRARTRDYFDAQLSLSEEMHLPVIVHDRDAHRDCLDIVRAHPNARGVFHCYAGSGEQARQLVDMGWMLSFTGNITFANARRAPEILSWLPIEHIMIETDAPYMAPEPFRGQRNDSGYVYRVAEKIAQIKGMAFEDVARITSENGRRFFGLA